MNRKTTFALAIFVILGVTAYFVTKRPKKGVRTTAKERPIAKIETKQVKRVAISSVKNKTIELALKGKTWSVSKPVPYGADKHAVDALLEKLEKLEFGDLVTERKDKHASHEVDAKSGVHVEVFGDKGTLADFYVGKIAAGYTMVRSAKNKQVFQAVGSIRHIFDKENKNWRDRTIINVKQSQVEKIGVTSSAGEILLARKSEKDAWKVEKSSKTIDQIDKQVVTSLLSSSYNLSAHDFADGKKAEETGLAQPKASLTLTLKGGKQVKLLVGANKKDDFWVKLADKPQIFIIKKYTAENLLRRPIDFREKTVLSFKAADVVSLTIDHVKDKKKTSITLTPKGADWLDGGKKIKGADKVKNAVSTLAALKADGFARFAAADYGLDKPPWTLTVSLKDRTKHVLTVGGKDKEGNYGLMRNGLDEIFVFRKYNIDRFLLEPTAYKAKAEKPQKAHKH